MNKPTPRFEFRVFAPDLLLLEERMRRSIPSHTGQQWAIRLDSELVQRCVIRAENLVRSEIKGLLSQLCNRMAQYDSRQGLV